MKCLITPTRLIYSNNGYNIIACDVMNPPDGMILNKYGNITVSGEINLKLGVQIEADLEEDTKSKYPASYKISLFNDDYDGERQLTQEEQYAILLQVTTQKQAQYIMDGCPNYVDLILHNKENEIDLKKIYNVKAAKHAVYTREIKSQFNFIMLKAKLQRWNFTDEELHKLSKLGDAKEITNIITEKPYEVYCEILERKFDSVDQFILSQLPQFETSAHRCEYCVLDILDTVESNGSTRLYANSLFQFIPSELTSLVKPTVIESEKIHYDEDTKFITKESTYQREKFVASKLKNIIKNNRNLGIDTRGYESIYLDDSHEKSLNLTDEQAKILTLVNESSVCMLNGSAGCVDCDTEFFNGKQWKKIKDYEYGDKVLQYNQDGTATLVHPERYIKVPCKELYHFETKYGLSQTVCDQHDIIYVSQKGFVRHTNIIDIIEKQKKSSSGFYGKFITSFNYNGEGIDLTDDEIRVMVAVIADGSFQKNTNTHHCRFHIKKENKKERLRMLLDNAKIEYKEHKSATEGYTDFYTTAPRREKVFTEYWYKCNAHQLEVICDEVMRWDGSTNYTKINDVKRQRFSTSIKESADFIQFAFTSINKRASIIVNDRRGRKKIVNGKEYEQKSIDYNVQVTDRNLVGICYDKRENHIRTMIEKIKTKDGFKYCFTVPSHMLVLRNNNNIFITGNCGKSASTKAIVNMLQDNGYSVRLLAPTGVAAKVASRYTGLHGSTIHMACFGEPHIFPEDVIIVDEISMVSLDTMYMLCECLSDNHRLIFIGDPAQLCSISMGNVLADLIESNVIPTVTLTKVFRYGIGGIATVATNVRNGERYVDDDGKLLFEMSDVDYKFIPINKEPLNQIATEYALLLEKYHYSDILILSPFNKSSFGTRAINSYIQNKYNPLNGRKQLSYKIAGEDVFFRENDLVINTKNNYDAKVAYSDFESCFIANGDIGKIVEINEDNNLIVQFDGNRLVEFNQLEMRKLLLGYAISVHRSQGCQAKAVMVITHPSHKRMLTRNMLYVACSRAQEHLVEIGDGETIGEAINVEETSERETNLRGFLMED